MSTVAVASLLDAIEQQINLGEHEPVAIYERICRLYGDEWVREEAAAHSETLTVALADRMIRANRRAAERALDNRSQKTKADLLLEWVWIPNRGRIRYAEATAADLRCRADWYDRTATLHQLRALWCRSVADLIDAEHASTLSEVSSSIPPLPGEEEL